MRRILLAALGLAAVSCTLYVATQLSGHGGTQSTTLGGCFDLPANQCGRCIAQRCEAPDAQLPVSLAQVCALDPEGNIELVVSNCASQPDISNSYCQESFLEGGVYAPSIATSGAAESNLRKCIFDQCQTSCSECLVQVSGCNAGTVPLADAGPCGTCLDNAMNTAGAGCQPYVLQGGCVEDPSAAIALCARTPQQCAPPDCSGLSSPDPSLTDAGWSLYACLWNACSSSCQ